MIPALALITIIAVSDLLHSRGLSVPMATGSVLPSGTWRPGVLLVASIGLVGTTFAASTWWASAGVVAGACVWLLTYLEGPRGVAMVLTVVIVAGLLTPVLLAGSSPLPARWDVLQKVLLVLAVIGINLATANRVVRAVLRLSGAPEPAPESNEPRAGRVIGVLERFLLTILVVASQGVSIAGVAAAKSIIRYPEISKAAQNKGGLSAEVFFIGTLTSWLIALASAGLIRLVG